MSWGPELHLTLVFDSPRRLAPASWTVDRPEGEDVLKFLGFHQSILQALTPHPVTRSRSRWVVEGRALESLSLLEQFSLASQADVLVGAHGAGLAWMVAMHPGSAVTELMPPTLPGYIACIETWDHPRNLRHGIYGGLAHTVGQHHICLRGNATALADPFEVDNFRERSFEIPLKVVLRRLSGLSSCSLTLWVPRGMMAVASGQWADSQPKVAIEGYHGASFHLEPFELESLSFAMGDLYLWPGASFGRMLGPSQTPESQLSWVLDAAVPLQVAVLPDQCLPDGGEIQKWRIKRWSDLVVMTEKRQRCLPGRGRFGLLMLPASFFPGDQTMSHLVALPLVEAWLGITSPSSSKSWIHRGLELWVCHRLLNQYKESLYVLITPGQRQDALPDVCVWLRAQEHGCHCLDESEERERTGERTRANGDGARQRFPQASGLNESQESLQALLRYLWLERRCADMDGFIRQLILRARKASLEEEDLVMMLKSFVPSATEWPSAAWCLQNFHEDPSEEKVSKLIIRTSIHVKVKWSILQKLYFLDLLSTSIYRESIIRMGKAYGFDLSTNMELLSRWCILLVKHNCQDHADVLKRFLAHQSRCSHLRALFRAVAQRSAELRWRFIAQDLWEHLEKNGVPEDSQLTIPWRLDISNRSSEISRYLVLFKPCAATGLDR
eukprot:g13038.t1